MPRVRPLTITQERKEVNTRGNRTLTDALVLYKLHESKTDSDIATKLGIHKQTIYRIRKTPGKVDLDVIRSIAHAIGMTQEDWLRLGGYKT